MKLLILGGTRFLGRHVVAAALERGHEVTLFNRGISDPKLFPQLERLRGDRDGDLSALAGRRWDAVIDTSAYVPRQVVATARLLADAIEHYTFISSISVYSDTTIMGLDEESPVATLTEDTERVTGSTYGALKALCEQALEHMLPGRVLHVRAGLIVGPWDTTDRFTYWPVRVALGGEVLAPGSPDRQVQFIDARDLAAWILRMAEARRAGVYNAAGPNYRLTIGRLLEVCRAVTESDAAFTWVDDDFLLEQGVTPFTELPLWVPAAYNGIQAIQIRKALAEGLAFRALEDTLYDTLAWNASRGDAVADDPLRLRAGMTLDREAELLTAWKRRR